MNEVLLMVLSFMQGVIALLIGYALGRGKLTTDAIKDLEVQVKRKLNTAPVGPVNRPSAKQLAAWADPKKVAEDEEMRKSLEQFPELRPQ